MKIFFETVQGVLSMFMIFFCHHFLLLCGAYVFLQSIVPKLERILPSYVL